jgi:uncharacterized coiled-coil DUF342 family protein
MSSKKEEVKNQFDSWLETQTEEVKTLLAERFSSLENTVKATREERDTFKNELKDLSKHVDENSEAGKQLTEAISRADAAEKKSNFIVEAVKQGAKRPTAAYAIAETEKLFDDKGNPDWNKIRESVPELFTVVNTSNNAGSGTNTSSLPNKNDFNSRVRDAANKSIK